MLIEDERTAVMGKITHPLHIGTSGNGCTEDGTGLGVPIVTDIDTHTHTHTHTVSTLQGGGKRGYRIDAESAAGGHLIVGGGRVDR
jgi:hypothetical protein